VVGPSGYYFATNSPWQSLWSRMIPRDKQELPAPVLGSTGGSAADGIHVPEIEVRSLAATVGAGSPGEALTLFGGVGVPAGFPGDHRCREMLGAVGIIPGLAG
jgi:hypothetical protein